MIRKEIRIQPEEAERWDSKLIHSVLQGDFHFLYDLMVEKFKLKKDFTESEIKTLNNIEVVLKIV